MPAGHESRKVTAESVEIVVPKTRDGWEWSRTQVTTATGN